MTESLLQEKITPGQYKTQPNYLLTKTGEMFYFVSPEQTPFKMAKLTLWIQDWLQQDKNQQHKDLIAFLAKTT